MPRTRLPVALVAALLLAGAASCARTIEGSGSIASDVVTETPAPTGGAGTGGAEDPTPSPSVNAVQVRERALCVLERAAITEINTSFNRARQRSQQITILKQGVATIGGQLSRSGLSAEDAVRRAAEAVHTQLSKLHTAADAGKSPSTKPYNDATRKFQQACNSIP